MLNQFIRAARGFALNIASRSAGRTSYVRDAVRRVVTTAHHAVMVLGLIAISALVMMFVKPDIANQLADLSPFSAATAQESENQAQEFAAFMDQPAKPLDQIAAGTMASAATERNKLADTPRQQQWVTNWLSKRYRVAGDATNMLVAAAYLTAQETKLDPLLILAVVAIESGFNPFAESAVGAQGLMQVMSKLHHEKFEELGGVKAALNPLANIKVGSLILKDYVRRGGSLEAGLKLYVGAAAFDTDFGYGAKVLAEYNRLKQVATGKRVPTIATTATVLTQKSQAAPRPAIELKPVPAVVDADSASVTPQDLTQLGSQQIAAL